MVQAAISGPSNIAEGAGRGSDREFKRFLSIALGSCRELDTQIEIARRLKVAEEAVIERVAERVDYECRMLVRLIKRL